MNYTIRAMKLSDLNQVLAIYLEGIKTGTATFQSCAPSTEEWHNAHLLECRYVAVDEADTVCGWVALSPTSSRCVYKGVCEVSIYIAQAHREKSLGTQLLQAVIAGSETAGIWSLYSAIIAVNKGSIALHEKCGFRQIGYRERIAKDINGHWQNTILMERRSDVVGID